MSYCQTHGRFDDYFNRGCPACQVAEQDRIHAEWELKNAVSEAAYAKANPGDYDCPHCLYRSLKLGASRCPLCHGEVGSAYWVDALAREKVKAEREAAASRVVRERRSVAEEAERIRTDAIRAAARETELIRAHNKAYKQAVLGVCLIFGGFFVIGIIAGYILEWIFGIPRFVTGLVTVALAWWRITVEVVRPYKTGEEKRLKQLGGR
ncbi:MAG: hypothetical protein AABO41_00295 [Acidobacteriota bacterium]